MKSDEIKSGQTCLIFMLQLSLATLFGSFPLALLDKIPTDSGKWSHLHGVLLCPSTACLSEGISRCDALHDNAATIYTECFAPCHIWSRIPPGYLSVPLDALLLCGKTRCVAREEGLTSPSN